MSLLFITWLSFANAFTTPTPIPYVGSVSQSAAIATTRADPFHLRLYAGGTAWKAIEVGRLSALYDLTDVTLRTDIGWLLDPWLCDVKVATDIACRGQRWEARFGPELRLNKHLIVPLQIGVFHRWSQERTPNPFRSEYDVGTLTLVREQTGLSLNAGLGFRAPASQSLAWGFEFTLSALAPASKAFQHRDYFPNQDPLFIVDPKASVFLEFTP